VRTYHKPNLVEIGKLGHISCNGHMS
jgi:hypothetical protein